MPIMPSTLSTKQREQFIKLCQAARAAIERGQLQDAQLYFRYAAQIHPHSITVWLGLAKVSTDLEDKRVALENILALDPSHLEAQQLLNEL
ncbi:MAG: hypothetical protein CUN55_07500 [Phototrophicales bacterium]|nr:MAG: hypothetical protein CUN55_07500 [Phototrophicales bacterium]